MHWYVELLCNPQSVRLAGRGAPTLHDCGMHCTPPAHSPLVWQSWADVWVGHTDTASHFEPP